jgi:hypothetical protein
MAQEGFPIVPWLRESKRLPAQLREVQEYDIDRLAQVDAAQQATAAQTATNTSAIGNINTNITALVAADVALDGRLDAVEFELGTLSDTSGNWDITLAGLKIQGGRVTVGAETSLAINFPSSFTTKVLGIFTQAIHNTTTAGTALNEQSGLVNSGFTLNGFTLINDGVAKDFFWWAAGI